MNSTTRASAPNLSLSRQLSGLMSRDEFFATLFILKLSQWTWLAGRALGPGIGMDRCPALYLWNQCDRMDCLLRWSERWLSRFGGDRRARLDDQLLRGFVDAHERALRIVRSLIDFQDVFHGGNKRLVGVGRNYPLLLAMRLENVFLTSPPSSGPGASWSRKGSRRCWPAELRPAGGFSTARRKQN